jgi:ferric-chelate reductase
VEDPKWQRNFTYVWVGAVLLAILFAVPRTLHGVRRGRAFTGSLGFWEGLGYSALVGDTKPPEPVPPRARLAATLDALSSVRLFSLGGKLNLGQSMPLHLILVGWLINRSLGGPIALRPAACVDHRQRPACQKSQSCRYGSYVWFGMQSRMTSCMSGFLAIAQLPIVFLFATKNSVLSLLLGPGNGYERLNYIHRWSGRCMLLAVVIHGGLWLRNHLQYGLAIMGQQKEGSGIASFGLLSVIVLSSLPPVRKHYYQTFRALQ